MAVADDIRDRGLLQIFSIGRQIRRTEIINALLRAHAGTVISGPFAGMSLLPEASWRDGDLPPKILGCYEAELHPAIVKASARNPKVVVNVGCAEGYYAVGMARLLPLARIYAFDSSPKAQDICKRAAVANRAGDRVVVAGKCEIELLRPVLQETGRCLLFVDCEGAEIDLLDDVRLPEILRCDMIIECHDCLNPLITKTLMTRFSASHDIENILEGPRDPNQFVSLRNWESLDRWLAVDEGRPVTMNWLVCWARR
jgi:hypothetical protein